jgi:hypothetical protein
MIEAQKVTERAVELDRVELEPVRIRILPGPHGGRLDRENAAKYLGKKPKTLAMWDLENPSKLGGFKIGGRQLYFYNRLAAVARGE